MKIGVLEDDPSICEVLTVMLEQNHHVVSIYQRGWDILDAVFFEESAVIPQPFDILLVDLLLQGEISGVQVIAQMRQSFPHMPIVVISAVSSQDLDNVKRMYPQVQIIQKPFTMDVLLAALETAVSYS
ncbi:MAG TPA: response regulator [Ktedonobacteraceae bacterium]|nr:response regulator [Ktedonobacteraceae bacterium]